MAPKLEIPPTLSSILEEPTQIDEADEAYEANNEKLPRIISFPAGNDDFRAARNECARACRRFNETPEDAAPEVRCRRWLE